MFDEEAGREAELVAAVRDRPAGRVSTIFAHGWAEGAAARRLRSSQTPRAL